MLQRIYGASFLTQKELDEYLEAAGGGEGPRPPQARQGARPLRLPSAGRRRRRSSSRRARLSTTACSTTCASEYRARGYDEVVTPQIFDVELFKISGHYANYRENMYFTEIDEREFGVKPMNCPGHFLLFQTRLWSYRDLPVRFADFGRLHRYELSGVTAGLTRVRTFSQDDGHIFTPFEKVETEIFAFLEFLDAVYGAFGFTDVEISLGLRPEKRIGADEQWDRGEAALDGGAEEGGTPVRGDARRRRLLRSQDRLPREGRDRPALAARHDPVRLRAARELRPDLHRRGRQAAPARSCSTARSSARSSASSGS